MDIKIRKFDVHHVIDVSGEVDVYNAHRLKDVVRTMIQKQVRVFILNLKKVTYVDSSGIGAVLAIHALLAHEGMEFRIVNVARTVMRVLELTRLVGFLPIMSTELEAIESIAAKELNASGLHMPESSAEKRITRT
jgi:anti-sigma B factor antagonist